MRIRAHRCCQYMPGCLAQSAPVRSFTQRVLAELASGTLLQRPERGVWMCCWCDCCRSDRATEPAHPQFVQQDNLCTSPCVPRYLSLALHMGLSNSLSSTAGNTMHTTFTPQRPRAGLHVVHGCVRRRDLQLQGRLAVHFNQLQHLRSPPTRTCKCFDISTAASACRPKKEPCNT